MRGLDGAIGLAKGGRRNLQFDFDDNDAEGDEEEDDGDDGKVLNFNNRHLSESNEDDEDINEIGG